MFGIRTFLYGTVPRFLNKCLSNASGPQTNLMGEEEPTCMVSPHLLEQQKHDYVAMKPNYCEAHCIAAHILGALERLCA